MRKTYAQEAYGEVVWFGRRGAGVKRARRSAGDGGKRAVLREEHEVSRKAIAQGRPECSRCPVCSCARSCAQIARETAGAASTRSSLRPLTGGREVDGKPRAISAARRRNHIPVIASAAKQSTSPLAAPWIASLRSPMTWRVFGCIKVLTYISQRRYSSPGKFKEDRMEIDVARVLGLVT